MGKKKFIKNFWSLHVDEAIVANWLKEKLPKSCEVFFPVNSQFQYVDLIVYNSKNKKTTTIQVKGSKAYEEKYDNKIYWTSRHKFWTSKINPDKVDFFIFSCFSVFSKSASKKTGSRNIENYFVVFPTTELKKYIRRMKLSKYLGSEKEISFSFYQYPENGKKNLYEDWHLKEYYEKNGYENLKPINRNRNNWEQIRSKLSN